MLEHVELSPLGGDHATGCHGLEAGARAPHAGCGGRADQPLEALLERKTFAGVAQHLALEQRQRLEPRRRLAAQALEPIAQVHPSTARRTESATSLPRLEVSPAGPTQEGQPSL